MNFIEAANIMFTYIAPRDGEKNTIYRNGMKRMRLNEAN